MYRISIPPKTYGFLRVKAKITGETLSRLITEKDPFTEAILGSNYDVYGGDILNTRITRDLSTAYVGHEYAAYRKRFVNFLANQHLAPFRYDILLCSREGAKTMRASPSSHDLSRKPQVTIAGRTVDWFWSDSGRFYLDNKSGPYVEVRPM